MPIRTIDELTADQLRSKYILLRDDFNVQIVDGKITDAFRIESSMPTIRKLVAAGARVAIVAHLGRPGGEKNLNYTLAPIAEFMNIKLVPDCLDKDFLPGMRDGDVVLLENVRFYAGEEKNDSEFAQKLAAGFDIFVNDAFAVSHRAHASTVGVAKILPSFAGELLAGEIAAISGVMENPKRPLLGIISGSKIGSKIGVIKALVKMCDSVIISGVIGTTFKIMTGDAPADMDLGANVQGNINDPKIKNIVSELMNFARENNRTIILPIDKGTAKSFEPGASRIDKTYDEMVSDDIIMDEGPQSVARYESAIDNAKTVIWNGPLGMAEWQPTWSRGTFEIARYIAARTRDGAMESIVGGGDVVAALEATDTKDDMTYVSTGGGAFLEFIEGIELPGIKILEK